MLLVEVGGLLAVLDLGGALEEEPETAYVAQRPCPWRSADELPAVLFVRMERVMELLSEPPICKDRRPADVDDHVLISHWYSLREHRPVPPAAHSDERDRIWARIASTAFPSSWPKRLAFTVPVAAALAAMLYYAPLSTRATDVALEAELLRESVTLSFLDDEAADDELESLVAALTD